MAHGGISLANSFSFVAVDGSRCYPGTINTITKEKDMKNKVYEFAIILLDENGEYTEAMWDDGPIAIIAKSAEAAKIKAVQYAPEGEYGKDYTILVREIKGE